MSIEQPDKKTDAPRTADDRPVSEHSAKADVHKQRYPPFRHIERLIQIGEASNRGTEMGRWKKLDDLGDPFQTELEEVAEVWANYNNDRPIQPLRLIALYDLSDRKAIKSTTLLSHDRTPIHLEVERTTGCRVDSAVERRSLAPIWRHLASSLSRSLLQERALRTIELKELQTRAEEIERESFRPCFIVELINIQSSIASIERDLEMIDSRLSVEPEVCRCTKCKP